MMSYTLNQYGIFFQKQFLAIDIAVLIISKRFIHRMVPLLFLTG
ncbi:hypothetical protein L911_0461 [Vibrio fluvialis I21563]|nr:hypothetical protein L911_0461 [Vibrio fluvialis I21563]